MINSSHGGEVLLDEGNGQSRCSFRPWVRRLPQYPVGADGPRPLDEVTSTENARQADAPVADRPAAGSETSDPPPAHSPPAVAMLGVVDSDPALSGVTLEAVLAGGTPVSDALDGATPLVGRAWVS